MQPKKVVENHRTLTKGASLSLKLIARPEGNYFWEGLWEAQNSLKKSILIQTLQKVHQVHDWSKAKDCYFIPS